MTTPTRAIAAFALAAVLLFCSAGASAQSSGSDASARPNLIVRTESRIQADRVWRELGEPLERMRITQGLSLHADGFVAPRGGGRGAAGVRGEEPDPIVLDVALRVDSDLLRGVNLSAADVGLRQAADVRLQQAVVRLRPGAGLELSLGRQLLWGALRPRDIDGARLAVETPANLDAWVAVGREVRLDPLTIDGAFFERLGGRYRYDDDPEPAEALLTELGAAWEIEALRVTLAHRQAVSAGRAVEGRSGGVLRLRAPGAARARLDLVGDFDHLSGAPQRLEAALQLEPGRVAEADTAVRLAWDLRRPDIDATSVFAIFEAQPSVGWTLDGHVRARDWGLGASARLRTWSGGDDVAWDGGWRGLAAGGGSAEGDEVSAGGALAFDWRPAPLWAMTARAGLDGGYGGWLSDADASARWEPLPERMAWSVRLRHAYEDADARAGHTLAGRVGFGYRLGRLGSARAWYEYVATHRTPAYVTLMAAFDFDLDVL